MLKKFLSIFTLAVLAAGLSTMGNAAEADLAAQASNEHGVKVTVTPRNFSGSNTWEFEVALETHTHPLIEDLPQVSALVADGKQYAPLGWDGAPPGGHHRKGSLRFKAITPQPSSVELQIRLTGEVTPRTFQWAMKGASHGN